MITRIVPGETIYITPAGRAGARSAFFKMHTNSHITC